MVFFDCNKGIFTRRELADIGITNSRHIREMTAKGQLTKIRHGFYATVNSNQKAVTAVRLHGSLGCLSALREHGLWVPPESGLHVTVSSHNHHIPKSGQCSSALIIHRKNRRFISPIDPPETALADACFFHDCETAAIVFESALRKNLLSQSGQRRIFNAMQIKKKNRLSPILNNLSESGSETRFKLFLHSLRIPYRQQVWIPNVGRVDFLVGRSLIVEIDSKSFHSKEADYHRDCVRNMHSMQAGYSVLRLSYRQIWFSWENTKQEIGCFLRKKSYR